MSSGPDGVRADAGGGLRAYARVFHAVSPAIAYPGSPTVFARYILPVLLSFAVKQLRKRNVRGAATPTNRGRSRSRSRFRF
jgi:hypothetical protein